MDAASHSRGAMRPSSDNFLPPGGRGECRVPNAPAASRGKNKNHTSVVTARSPGSPGIPARNGFNGFFRALPGDRAFLSPSSANRVLSKPGRAGKTSADLTPASRRQDHPTSPSASVPFVCAHRDRSRKSALRSPLRAGAAASTASRPNVRDDGQRPSEGRDGESYRFDLGFGKTEIFFQKGLDRQQHEPSLICPTGKQFDPFQEFFALRPHSSDPLAGD